MKEAIHNEPQGRERSRKKRLNRKWPNGKPGLTARIWRDLKIVFFLPCLRWLDKRKGLIKK